MDRINIDTIGCTEEFKAELLDFLDEWYDCDTEVSVRTSGSTGVPKVMRINKECMRQSALLTCSFLGLKAGDTALLCMPVRYIAGKMMIVRAIVGSLKLIAVTPSANPMAEVEEQISFVAMTPMQVQSSLQNVVEHERLQAVGSLIIGGGAIDSMLENELRHFPNAIYSTYGMTETLSHIAMRKLSGNDATHYYTPLPFVDLSLSENDTLIIYAPRVCSKKLVTNDVAELLADGRFRIKGRTDNVINSGGVKIQAEEVEASLQEYTNNEIAITSIPDERYGEALVLLIEEGISDKLTKAISNLPKYHKPKQHAVVKKIPQTPTGKKDRVAIRELTKWVFSK